ncbi:helitron_like_N domain-containing protein [Trichonephila clavipes]|nr:helitron_like_N domain-containing protein [Trichonephila clavipes]
MRVKDAHLITFTCNPNWPETTVELLLGQVAADHVDLDVRVFKQKVKKMLHVIKDVQVFGKVAYFMRTATHASLDKEEYPILYEVVPKFMIHGHFCNRNSKAPCIVEDKCSKRCPRQMFQETHTGDDGYPLYHRRKPGDGGHVSPGRAPESGMWEDVDNSWVVPYSPLFCRIFKAHINVEYCNSVKSIKIRTIHL